MPALPSVIHEWMYGVRVEISLDVHAPQKSAANFNNIGAIVAIVEVSTIRVSFVGISNTITSKESNCFVFLSA